jgi:HSP20 family protein
MTATDVKPIRPEVEAPRVVIPRVEVSESDKLLRLTAEMPGVTPEGVSVDLHEPVLTLEGKPQSRSSDSKPIVFRRRFTLSDAEAFDADSIKARVTNGVLSLELPKREKPGPRHIEINPS